MFVYINGTDPRCILQLENIIPEKKDTVEFDVFYFSAIEWMVKGDEFMRNFLCIQEVSNRLGEACTHPSAKSKHTSLPPRCSYIYAKPGRAIYHCSSDLRLRCSLIENAFELEYRGLKYIWWSSFRDIECRRPYYGERTSVGR